MNRRARSFRRALRQTEEINLSPLIDMIFILLIFFIVTTVFVEETGVEVHRPEAASAVDLDQQAVLIAITDEGSVFYGGRRLEPAGSGPSCAESIRGNPLQSSFRPIGGFPRNSWCG